MRRWLARLSFSFFILAFVLGWQGYQWKRLEGQTPRVIASIVGAAMCAAAGLAGVRERHRPDN